MKKRMKTKTKERGPKWQQAIDDTQDLLAKYGLETVVLNLAGLCRARGEHLGEYKEYVGARKFNRARDALLAALPKVAGL
jgi:hypothetical protein